MNPADQLTAALADRIGLRPEISRPKVLEILREKSASHPESWIPDLLQAPPSSPDWLQFIAPFLIHETYFFRHPAQLQFLADKVLPSLILERKNQGRLLFRAWCAACSSGEEAYSLGLLLRDAFSKLFEQASAPAWHIQIVGTDLSPAMIQRARSGEYRAASGLNSFRDIPPFAKHHFPNIQPNADTRSAWIADADLRRSISFQQANLIDDPPPLADLDLILCRNILIYFEDSKIRSVLDKFKSVLRPGGALMLGPADSLRDLDAFDSLTDNRVMVWKKKGARCS